jgi:hypothetical protein
MIEYLNNILIQINTSRKVLTILMRHTDSHSRVNVVRANGAQDVIIEYV